MIMADIFLPRKFSTLNRMPVYTVINRAKIDFKAVMVQIPIYGRKERK